MKAVIVAGGSGKRLGKITQKLPKPLVRINGKPVVEHQLELLVKNGIKEVWLLVGYKADLIKNYFGDGQKWGIKIRYSIETKPLGTAGAVKSIANKLTDDFLVIYGDLMINFDLNRFIQFHHQHGQKSVASIIVHTSDHPLDTDLVVVKRHKIIKIYSRPHRADVWRHNLENASVFILSPKIFDFIPDDRPSDFASEIFHFLLKKRQIITAYHSWEYFRDIGDPNRLKTVRKECKQGNHQKLHFQNKQKAIFLDRDGVVNEEVGGVDHPDKLQLFPFAPSAIKKINQSDFHAIVITNQSVVAKERVTKGQLEEIHCKLETLLGVQGAVINRIYYCPHHPIKRICCCRKPEIGLIKKAIQDFNIDLSQSYLIGDMVSDYQTAKNAGIKFIGVKTGFGCQPRPGKDEPIIDKIIVKENFEDAVGYILKHSS